METDKIRYKRKLYTDIEKRIEDKEIIVITGMRRVGKTTLLRMIYDEIKSVYPCRAYGCYGAILSRRPSVD